MINLSVQFKSGEETKVLCKFRAVIGSKYYLELDGIELTERDCGCKNTYFDSERKTLGTANCTYPAKLVDSDPALVLSHKITCSLERLGWLLGLKPGDAVTTEFFSISKPAPATFLELKIMPQMFTGIGVKLEGSDDFIDSNWLL